MKRLKNAELCCFAVSLSDGERRDSRDFRSRLARGACSADSLSPSPRLPGPAESSEDTLAHSIFSDYDTTETPHS